jgi:hypothetical protein
MVPDASSQRRRDPGPGEALFFLAGARNFAVPVTYNIDAAARLIRTACTAPLNFTQVINHFRTLAIDPACVGYLDVMLDLSDADLLPASDQLGAVNTEIAAIRDKVQFGACAIVAPRDAMFGMMRIFSVLASPYFKAIQVFRQANEAEIWMASQRS